jgi:hypothetical protein
VEIADHGSAIPGTTKQVFLAFFSKKGFHLWCFVGSRRKLVFADELANPIAPAALFRRMIRLALENEIALENLHLVSCSEVRGRDI